MLANVHSESDDNAPLSCGQHTLYANSDMITF